jgi:hypothetical protein
MLVMLRNVRIAFPQLFEAKQVNGEGTPAYSASFIFDKKHPAVKDIQAAIEKTGNEKWGAKWPAVKKALKGVCLQDGDTKAEYEGYEGNMFVSARNTKRPLVLDTNKSPLTEADGKPYAGCYVNAQIEVWAQDNNWGKRINAQLKAVQFASDGDAFSAGGAPADPEAFDDLSVEESLV